MTLDQLGKIAKGAWRPFTGYSGAVAVIVGLFVPSVTADKMMVLASLVGGIGWFRSQDKKHALQAKADPAQAIGDTN